MNFSKPNPGSITYMPGLLQQYSSDRKAGTINRRVGGNPEPVGATLDMVILEHYGPFTADLFAQDKEDTWISLGFVDPSNIVSVMLLNSGTTESIRAWIEFAASLNFYSVEIEEVITTISFRPFKSGRGNAYKFTYREAKGKDEKSRMELIQNWYNETKPILIHPAIPREVGIPLLDAAGCSPAEIASIGFRSLPSDSTIEVSGEIA